MKMILAIVQDPFVNDLAKELLKQEVRITRLASTGGFFKTGNTTLLIGVGEEQLEPVLDTIKAVTQGAATGDDNVFAVNLFVLDVDEYVRY